MLRLFWVQRLLVNGPPSAKGRHCGRQDGRCSRCVCRCIVIYSHVLHAWHHSVGWNVREGDPPPPTSLEHNAAQCGVLTTRPRRSAPSQQRALGADGFWSPRSNAIFTFCFGPTRSLSLTGGTHLAARGGRVLVWGSYPTDTMWKTEPLAFQFCPEISD